MPHPRMNRQMLKPKDAYYASVWRQLLCVFFDFIVLRFLYSYLNAPRTAFERSTIPSYVPGPIAPEERSFSKSVVLSPLGLNAIYFDESIIFSGIKRIHQMR